MPRKLRFILGKAMRKNKRQQAAAAQAVNVGDVEEEPAEIISATPEELREALKSRKKKTSQIEPNRSKRKSRFENAVFGRLL